MSRRVIAWIALVAQFVFTATWLVAPLWQGPRYSVLAHSISDMYAVTAPAAGIIIVVFTLSGIATLVFVLLPLRAAFAGAGWPAVVATVLLALSIFGLGDLLTPFERLACRLADAGCSSGDQVANAGGQLDSTLSTIGVLVLIAAAFFLAEAMRRTRGWSPLAWPTRIVGIVLAVDLAVSIVAPAIGIAGLTERVLAIFGAGGFAALAAGILRRG